MAKNEKHRVEEQNSAAEQFELLPMQCSVCKAGMIFRRPRQRHMRSTKSARFLRLIAWCILQPEMACPGRFCSA